VNERRGTYRPPDKRKRRGNPGGPNRDFHSRPGKGPQQGGQNGGGSNRNRFRPQNQGQVNTGAPIDNYHQRNRGQPRGNFNPAEQPNRQGNNYKPRNSRPQPGRLPDGSFDVFELFCAYHLGITEDGGYHQQNIHDLARRFNCTPAELKQALVDHGLDSQTMINSDFDLSMAQLDIMVAPEGVDKRELAKPWFDEFRKSRTNVRDWNREIEEDARANAKIFGDDK